MLTTEFHGSSSLLSNIGQSIFDDSMRVGSFHGGESWSYLIRVRIQGISEAGSWPVLVRASPLVLIQEASRCVVVLVRGIWGYFIQV